MPPQEIFLSHSDRDRTFVARLAETLRRHGLPVWYSSTDMVGAQQWHDEIGSALRLQMIDFTQDFEQGARELMRVWELGYRPE